MSFSFTVVFFCFLFILCGLSTVSSLVYCGQKKQAGLIFEQNFRHEYCQRMQANLNRIVGGDSTRIIPGL